MKTKILTIIFFLGALLTAFYSLPLEAQNNSEIKTGYISISQNFNNIFKTEFPFNALGFKWESEKMAIDNFYLKTSPDNKKWSDWQKITTNLEDDRPDFDQNFNLHYSDLIFTGENQYFKLRGEMNGLKNLEVIYFDSTEGPKIKKESWWLKFLKTFKIVSSTDQLKVISREEWGANDSWRYCVEWNSSKDRCEKADYSSPRWPLEYQEIDKVVIHHTASSQGDDDPAASVRAIYKWHAISHGWGDIGYNYLIDKDGNIYEGRYGGDGIVAGHTYGYNSGTMGIAIIGTYGGWLKENYQGEYQEKHPEENIKEEKSENGSWQVYIDNQISSAAQKALAQLLASKARDFEFIPEAASDFKKLINIPNIVGHRDIGSTHCPGDNLYGNLLLVRQETQNKFADLGGLDIKYRATKIAQSEQMVRLKKDETAFVWVELQNNGDTTWHNFTSQPVYLAPADIKNKLSSLDSFKIATTSEDQPSTEKEEMKNFILPQNYYPLKSTHVAPGENIRFTFTVQGNPLLASEEKKMILALGNKGWFTNSEFNFTIQMTDLDYAAEPSSHNMPVAIFDQSEHQIILTYKNTGAKEWKEGEILLNIIDKEKSDRHSQFKHKEWNSFLGELTPVEKTIKPSEKATFVFKILAPGPGTFRQSFYLTRKVTKKNHPEIVLGTEKIAGSDFELLTRVDAPYAAKIITQEIIPAMLTGWRPTVKFEFENTGSQSWKNVSLVTYVGNDEISPFRDKSWFGRYTIQQYKKEVKPGDKVSFIFKLKAPTKAGEYQQIYELQIGKTILYINQSKQLIINTRVDKTQ